MAESTKHRSDESETASSWVASRQQQAKSPFTVVKWLIALVALLFVVGIASFMVPAIQAGGSQREALQRARAIPQEEREKMLRMCMEISRQVQPDEYERIFGDGAQNEPIPPEFAALQAMRLNVRKNSASIKLHYSFDSGVGIGVNDLDTATPSAELFWGEVGEREPWAALKAAP